MLSCYGATVSKCQQKGQRAQKIDKYTKKIVLVPNVVECEALIVFVDDLGGDGLGNNLGEDGILRLLEKRRGGDVLFRIVGHVSGD